MDNMMNTDNQNSKNQKVKARTLCISLDIYYASLNVQGPFHK